MEVRRRPRANTIKFEQPIRQAAGQTRAAKVIDHNAVQHDFLLHLLLFISRSSGTLRSMICLGRINRSFGHYAPLCGLIAASSLALRFYRAFRVLPVRP